MARSTPSQSRSSCAGRGSRTTVCSSPHKGEEQLGALIKTWLLRLSRLCFKHKIGYLLRVTQLRKIVLVICASIAVLGIGAAWAIQHAKAVHAAQVCDFLCDDGGGGWDVLTMDVRYKGGANPLHNGDQVHRGSEFTVSVTYHTCHPFTNSDNTGCKGSSQGKTDINKVDLWIGLDGIDTAFDGWTGYRNDSSPNR